MSMTQDPQDKNKRTIRIPDRGVASVARSDRPRAVIAWACLVVALVGYAIVLVRYAHGFHCGQG